MIKIILASASPRRKELLNKIGLKFDVIPSDYDEKISDNNFSYKKIETLALNKAKDVMQKIKEPSVIIAADTVVVLNDKILGKPHSKQEAREMITALGGKTHEVITSIAMINTLTQKILIKSTSTQVTFRELEATEIEDYINTDEPYDKAGAYAAQGLASIFIEKINGCFNNVVGISVFEVNRMLKEII